MRVPMTPKPIKCCSVVAMEAAAGDPAALAKAATKAFTHLEVLRYHVSRYMHLQAAAELSG